MVAVRFVSTDPAARSTLVAKAVVLGIAAFVTGLIAVGVTITAGNAILKGNGITVMPISALTGIRVVIGVAAALALAALLALGLGSLLRKGWAAILVAVSGIALPYAVGALPLLPDSVARGLLRLTPAAGFAVQQTLVEYPQVVAHDAPSAGYFPLPWWAGFAVLCAYTLITLAVALYRLPRGADQTGRPAYWR